MKLQLCIILLFFAVLKADRLVARARKRYLENKTDRFLELMAHVRRDSERRKSCEALLFRNGTQS